MAEEKRRDKGSLPDSPVRTKKRKPVRKRYVLYCRMIGPPTALEKLACLREHFRSERVWHVYRRYVSATARDEALRTLLLKQNSEHRDYEYRKYEQL